MTPTATPALLLVKNPALAVFSMHLASVPAFFAFFLDRVDSRRSAFAGVSAAAVGAGVGARVGAFVFAFCQSQKSCLAHSVFEACVSQMLCLCLQDSSTKAQNSCSLHLSLLRAAHVACILWHFLLVESQWQN